MNATEDEKSANLSEHLIQSHSKPLLLYSQNKAKRSSQLLQLTGTLQFEPLRFSDVQKELEEAEKEPLLYDEQTVDEENISIKENISDTINGNEIVQKDSNEHDTSKDKVSLGVAWLSTPAKSERHPFSNFLTPANCKSHLTPKPRYKSSLANVDEHLPKIQCSVSVESILKTPITSASREYQHKMRHTPLLKQKSESVALKTVSHDNHNNEKVNVNKVQFSMPVDRPLIEQFGTLTVKNVNYIVLNELGKGGSSVVFHCYDPESKCERAIKRVNLNIDSTAVDGYINEVKMLHKLQHCDRIITMYDYEILEAEKVLMIVLERGCSDLSKMLKEFAGNSRHLPTYVLIYYWMEMLYAVKQIHENGIIHSDLKPANFLNVSSRLKLIDFGIASCLQNDMTSIIKNITIGSFNYISPEALKNNSTDSNSQKYKISYKSDVWSLGCMLYQLVYRKTPFQHIGHMYAKLSAILDPDQKIQYTDASWVPLYVIKTIKNCLQYDMKSRPSVDELIEEYEKMYC